MQVSSIGINYVAGRVRPIHVAREELTFSFARSSGPGGQNVNKVNSKAILRFRPADSGSLPADVRQRFLSRYASRLTSDGELVLSSDRHRDQGRNVADCIERLDRLVEAVARPPRVRKPTRPSRSSIEKRLKAKRIRSAKKLDRRSADAE